jgi:predicted dehydrogenase
MESPRVAIVGASHWHVPLYVKGIIELGIHVCGIQDIDLDFSIRLAKELNTVGYDNINELLDEVKPDFVFAFAKHHEMPSLAKNLINRRIPFAIEKPVGMNFQQVEELEKLAKVNNVFCSIPFVWRYSDVVESIKSQINPDDLVHLSFRFVAGPPERYLENGSPWMMDIQQAGGGCMTNLGVHFLDLALYLTGSKNIKVLSAIHHHSSRYSVEDYSVTHLVTEKGVTISIETGYAYPMTETQKRDNEWKIVTKNGYHTLSEGKIEYRHINKTVDNYSVTTDSDPLYPVFVQQTLHEWMTGKHPSTNLFQMAQVRMILDEINEKAILK